MTKIINSIIVVFILFFLGCSKDKGNYFLQHINEVEIGNIKNENAVTIGNKIVIEPTFLRKLEASEDGLEYSWTVNGKEIATTRDLNYLVTEEMKVGTKNCRYIVTDTKNGMKYFKTFRMEVMNRFNWGYYFLTEGQDNSTELAFFSVINDNKEFAYTDRIGHIPFGKKPMLISGRAGNITLEGAITYCFLFKVITEEGQSPVISSETATFYPNQTISEKNFVDPAAGYTFKPTEFLTMLGTDEYFCSNGQLISFVSQILYRPAKHDKKYYWSHCLLHTAGELVVFAYDELSKTYYSLSPEITQPDKGIFRDTKAFDRVIPITGFPSLEGHTIVHATAGPDNSYPCEPTVITSKDGVLNFYQFEFNTGMYPGDPEFGQSKMLKSEQVTIPGAGPDSKITATTYDWFIAVKNKIYIAAKGDLKTARLFATLPEDIGEITTMKPSAKGTKLVISTYNSSSSEAKKGSVVFVNTSTGAILETDIHKNVIQKCVSIFSANYWYIYGKDE